MTDSHRPDTDSQKSTLAQKLEALYSEILERVDFGVVPTSDHAIPTVRAAVTISSRISSCAITTCKNCNLNWLTSACLL